MHGWHGLHRQVLAAVVVTAALVAAGASSPSAADHK